MPIKENLEMVRFYFSLRNLRAIFRHGMPGSRRFGYDAGRMARRRALVKKVRRLRRRYEAAERELDEFDRAEKARRGISP